MSDYVTTAPSPLAWQDYYSEQSRCCKDVRLKTFFDAGVVDPETPLNEVPFVALDFETTGLNPHEHSIVSVGMVPFTLARIRCRKASHFIVKPRQTLLSESVTIHGITHSDVRSAPDFDEVLHEFLLKLAKQVVVVHYRHIERDFLNIALLARIQEQLFFPVIDTMMLEEQILRKQRSVISSVLGRRSTLSLRLPDIRERYGLPRYHLHHAMTDALATAELLQAQIAYHFDEKTPISRLWC
ncbi:MAG: DNA polymerase-3 subunit epsilon [Pseudohongiellaceae bacterium]|jgi:DNA polymerase-3 subunit epsilon